MSNGIRIECDFSVFQKCDKQHLDFTYSYVLDNFLKIHFFELKFWQNAF